MRLHAAECLKNCGYMSSRTGRLRWYVRIGAPLLDSHEETAYKLKSPHFLIFVQ